MEKRFCPNTRDDNSLTILYDRLKAKFHACMLWKENQLHHFQGPVKNEIQGSIFKK